MNCCLDYYPLIQGIQLSEQNDPDLAFPYTLYARTISLKNEIEHGHVSRYKKN